MITYKLLKSWQTQLDAARNVLPADEQEVHSALSALSDEISGELIDLVKEADPSAPFDMGRMANDLLASIGGRPMGVLS